MKEWLLKHIACNDTLRGYTLLAICMGGVYFVMSFGAWYGFLTTLALQCLWLVWALLVTPGAMEQLKIGSSLLRSKK